MSKTILFDKDARKKLIKGIETLAKAVTSTLGPRGMNVIIEKPFVTPHVTKDGISVAKEISLKDPTENMGVMILREAASTTANTAGDGTTTSTLLAYELIKKSIEAVDAGENPNTIVKNFNKSLQILKDGLSNLSENIDINSDRVKQVATISANNDEELGSIIAEAIQMVGLDGIVTVQESRDVSTTIKSYQGAQFDKGYMHEGFITNTNKMTAEYDNAFILFINGNLREIQSLTPVFDVVGSIGRPIIIVADDIIEQTIHMLNLNKAQRGLQVVAVKAPSFGDNRKDTMLDLAITTGGQYVTVEQLDHFNPTMLGECAKVVVGKNSTLFMDGAGDEEEITMRVNGIKTQMEECNIQQYKDQMAERIAKLTGGVASIQVGAVTEMAMRQKKDRVDDAVAATKAALEEGIVPGGGVALISLESLEGLDEITKSILNKPLMKMLELANIQPDQKSIQNGLGYNAVTEEWVDMKSNGIIDPTKVVRVSLENAVAVATTILTTNVAITMLPEEKPKDVSHHF